MLVDFKVLKKQLKKILKHYDKLQTIQVTIDDDGAHALKYVLNITVIEGIDLSILLKDLQTIFTNNDDVPLIINVVDLITKNGAEKKKTLEFIFNGPTVKLVY